MIVSKNILKNPEKIVLENSYSVQHIIRKSKLYQNLMVGEQ